VDFLIVSLLNGLSYGLLLFMLSSGLTLILGMMGVLNFAHTSFYMLGAYFGYQISRWFGFWPALAIAPLAVGIIGALVERYGLRRMHRFGHVAELLLTFGLAFMIEEIVHLVWGRAPVEYRIPAELDRTLFSLFQFQYSAYRAFMMLVSLVMLAALYFGLTRSRTGLIIQASLTHPQMVESLGHNVPRTFMLVFGGGSALAGLAGVIGGNAFITEPGMAAAVGSIVFVIVVVGGMGSLYGAFIGSLLIGVLQTFSAASDMSLHRLFGLVGWHPTFSGPAAELVGVKVSQLAPILPYVLLVAMLILRPQGLMGTREEE
jgi:branched-chain amino acid transport system permease protein